MRAQTFNIEFVIALTIFIFLISWCYIYMTDTLPFFYDESRSSSLRSRAFQISELLVSGEGYPSSWSSATVQVLGFMDESYDKRGFISERKLDEFGELSDEDVAELLDIEYETHFYILAEKEGRQWESGNSGIVGKEVERVTVSSSDGKIVKIKVILA